MASERKGKFSARLWLKGEIEGMRDTYGNTVAEAKEFIREQLLGDEYRDELSDSQVKKVLAII